MPLSTHIHTQLPLLLPDKELQFNTHHSQFTGLGDKQCEKSFIKPDELP